MPQERAVRMTTTRISAKRQVTIPANVRRRSGLAAGDIVRIEAKRPGLIDIRKVRA